ncbi:MAG TPA: 4Fe-4S dicluster domain-containing protein [Desulfomicrobiaceae bacterium]|nr:4Fe-4S dicluster domain-containing protein [Desulfomicrobiaceae bacterium]
MEGKSFFIDLTRCTACRGCQVACKQWHKLPAEKTKNWGSHQNPKDLSFITYKLVRFQEVVKDGDVTDWLFFPEQCRHCVEPPCKYVADAYDEKAILKDPNTGAVIFTERTKALDAEEIRESCPYNIPRADAASGIISKCDMCLDRVENGLLPACVQTCPTGAMNFGDREDMLELANERLATVKKQYPDAVLGDPDETRVIYLYQMEPMSYYEFAVAGISPMPLYNRKQMLAKLFTPLRTSRG